MKKLLSYLLLTITALTSCQNSIRAPTPDSTVLMVNISNFLGSDCARVDFTITNQANKAQFSKGVDRPTTTNSTQALLEVKNSSLASGTSVLLEAWCRQDNGNVGYSKKTVLFSKDPSKYFESFFVSPRASPHSDEITTPGPRFDAFTF
jgi:hypothetical protein